MRRALLGSALFSLLACTNEQAPVETVVIDDNALLRLKNSTGTSWLAHIAAGKRQVTAFSYEVVFGSYPLSVTFDLSKLEDGHSTGYQALDAGIIEDTNVLHTWYYDYNQAGSGSGSYTGASESQQAYGRLGLDLTLEKNTYYTLELGRTGSKLLANSRAD